MKIRQLNKMFLIEYLKLAALILIGFLLIDVVYCCLFKNSSNLCLHWMCGTNDEPISIAMIILKLLNISLIFMYVGSVCERFGKKYMVQVFCRISKCIPFVMEYTLLLVIHSSILLICSHYIFYCVSGAMPDVIYICRYFLLDSLSLDGLILIYIMLNNSEMKDWSLLLVMGILVINTFSPIPLPFAASTIRFIEMSNQLGYFRLYFSTFVCLIFIIGVYACFFSRRRYSLC
ncbi:MAG: hypothetical protein VZR24_10075 [Butyrivibrio hungatei]|nr:hypothetical protein [Butyrivibrio hungatei]